MGENFYYRGHDQEGGIERLERASLIAVDMESVNLNDYTAVGIGCYISPSEGFYFPIFPEPSEYMPLIMGKIADPGVTKIYHNGIGFDLEVLDRLADSDGFERPEDTNIEDTSIMAQVHGLPAGLERLGREWLGFDDLFSIKSLFSEYNCTDMLGVPESRVAEKCLNDCRTTFALYEYLQPRLSPEQRDCYEVDRQLIHVLRTVQNRGLSLRQGLLEEHRERLQRNLVRIQRECDAEGGFNPGSPQQVGYVLASRGNILPFTPSRQLKTADDVLEGLEDPLAAMVLEYRSDRTLLGNFVEPWIGKDRAYTHFRLDLATGRLASGRVNAWDTKNRNMQNVPPKMREVFRPDSGIWSWADYSQLELRMLAGLSRDSNMLAEYAKAKPDLHQATADAAHRMGLVNFTRDNGKTFNFARVFGAGDHKLSKSTGVPLKQVPVVRAAMAEQFPESEAWIRQQMYNHGEYAETLFGRRCRLPEMRDDVDYNPKAFEAHVAKCAVNYPCQGSGADIAKRGMLQIFKTGVDLRLQVHDEFLVDGDWEPDPGLGKIHPEFATPFELKKGVIWV